MSTARVENLFSARLADDNWLAAAFGLCRLAMPGKSGLWLLLRQRQDERYTMFEAEWDGEDARRMVFEFPAATVRDFRERAARAGLTTVSAAGLWTESARDLFGEMRCADAVAFACEQAGAGLVMGRLLERRAARPPAVRTDLLLAIAAAWRVRMWIRRVGPIAASEAVFSPAGGVMHAVGLARERPWIDILRAAVTRRDRGRRRIEGRCRGPKLWTGLVQGRWSLLHDYEEGGRRYVLAVRNNAQGNPFALTRVEARAVEDMSQGRSAKQTAGDLGVSLAQIYVCRARAAQKLLSPSAVHLAGLAGALPSAVLTEIGLEHSDIRAFRMRPGGAVLPTLTEAERHVATDMAQALSYREISRRRGTSPRTVANQVQSIYRKLRVRSRSELAVALESGAPATDRPMKS